MEKENKLVVFNSAVELQSEIEEVVAKYDDLTDDDLIAERPNINKDFNKYDRQRITVNREINNFMKNILEPISDLKKRVDDLHAEKETKRRDAKREEIEAYYEETYGYEQKYYDRVWDERWLNATHNKWKEEMELKLTLLVTDVETIQRLGYDEDAFWNGKTLNEFYEEEKAKQEKEAQVIEADFEEKQVDTPTPSFIVEGISEVTFSVTVNAGNQEERLENFLKFNGFDYKKGV